MTLLHEQQLQEMLAGDPFRMMALEAVGQMKLPDCWIGAGFIRSFVWDRLADLPPVMPEDVDVVYFDPDNTSEEIEKAHDAALANFMPGVPWSCKNQARMHVKAGLTEQYRDTGDGLWHWTETATAVAARLGPAGTIDILAPFGLDDLFNMTVRPTPFFAGRLADYHARIEAKKWQQRWPALRFEATPP